MNRANSYFSVIRFHVIINCIIALFITGASYYHTPLNGVKDTLVYFIHFCLLQTTIAGFVYFLSLNRLVFKTLFSILFLLFGFIAFWKYSLDISMSDSIINAALQTKPYIVLDLITAPLLLYLLVLIVLLKFILKSYKKITPTKGVIVFSMLSILCMFLFFIIENKRHNSFKSRLPFSAYYSLKAYLNKTKITLDSNINLSSKKINSINTVLVLGESVRADHLGINGYSRNTTPLLNKQHNIISYSNLFTNKTYTAISLPQLLTNQKINDSTSGPFKSVFSVLNKNGIPTSWIGNQLLETDYESIVLTNSNIKIIDSLRSVYSFNKLKDKALLSPFKKQLLLSNKQVTTLHMIGSHWWYENRYTAKQRHFTPVIDSKYIPSLTQNQIINSYDNTLVYLDEFLNEVITETKKEQTPSLVIYVSDHGESLGEDGLWLHAQDSEFLKNPAFIIWFSEEFKILYPEKVAYFEALKNQKITTNLIYHLLLSVYNIH